MTNNQRKRRNKLNEKEKNSENYSNTDISDYTISDSDEKNDQGWKKANYRKQRRTPHRTNNYISNDNITHRKNRQNNNNSKYTMENQPPKNSDKNYTNIQKPAEQNQTAPPQQLKTIDENLTKQTNTPEENNQPQTSTEPQPEISDNPKKTVTEELTTIPKTNTISEVEIIPETNPITEIEQQEETSSPSLAMSNTYHLLQNTPNSEDITTPNIMPINNENDYEKPTPKAKKKNTTNQNTEISKTKSPLSIDQRLMKAKKLSTKPLATSFCDIRTLSKATNDEGVTILALSMYHRLGLFDPSNKYVIDYKNKNILNKYKKISEERPTKTNTLLEITIL